MTTFSVLLPTRNGGPLLRTCVEAVLAQTGADFELVVSDNANTDETPAVLREFADDPRLVALRQERLLGVTDNWNAALEAARGDYVLMIGDDDLLLPGCLAALEAGLDARGRPDCLTFNAVRYIAPDALAGTTSSWYSAPYFNFEERVRGQARLSAELRREIAADLFEFRFRFPLTMQLHVVADRAIARLRKGLFRSVFPDHYAIGALLLTARSWGFWDACPVVIGVSAKSFGHYFFNHRDAGALGYLGVAPQFAGRLPGTEVTDASAAWLLELQRDYADLLPGTRVSRPAYVARQLWAWLQDFRAGGLEAAELWQRLKLLSGRDLVGLAGLLTRPEARAHVLRSLRRLRGASSRTDPLWETLHELPGIDDIASFAEWWTSHHGGVGAGVSGSRTA